MTSIDFAKRYTFRCLAVLNLNKSDAFTEKMENEFSGWSCETEVNLFHAMRGHKPVGMQNKEGLSGPNPH